jgi:DNA-binding MarR family transcriptional regulator
MQASLKGPARQNHRELVDEIVGQLVRRRSTADVLFHHAVARRLGLGPADHKCLDVLREGGPMSSSQLAAITGLTSGAVTGVVARLEQAGYLSREPDPRDGRKQILRLVVERMGDFQAIFGPLRQDVAAVLEPFDTHQLAAIAEFLARTTDIVYRYVALLRGQRLHIANRTAGAANATASKTPQKRATGLRHRRGR